MARRRKKKHSSLILKALNRILIFIFLMGVIFYSLDNYVFTSKVIKDSKTYNIRGIDISWYQGRINWNKLEEAKIDDTPIHFVIIKATEGSSYKDINFKTNFRNARKHGFVRGAYHYWSNRTSPKRQADFFISRVKLRKGDLAPVLDVEDFPRSKSKKDFQRDVLQWLDIVEKEYGITPIIYTGYKFKEDYLDIHDFERYPLWIAHYDVEKLRYGGEWKFWQYSEDGSVEGINTKVDLNIFNGSLKDFERLTLR